MSKVYFFEPLLVFDDRCYAKIGSKLLWNCENFIRMLERDIVLYEADYLPIPGDSDNFISLGGWLFDLSSTVNNTATCEEVIEGWKIINNRDLEFVLDRLFQPIFKQLILSTKHTSYYEFRKNEPALIELLRLAYWYSKCYTDTSASKRKEIRDKLFGDLLTKIEKYKAVIKMKDEYPEERKAFLKKVNENMKAASITKKPDKDHERFVKELVTALWSVNSELIFAGLVSEQGYRLKFEKAYDFLINDIPCQVKTILPRGEEYQKILHKICNRTRELWQGKNIEELEVRTEVDILLRKKCSLIDHAIRQGGKLVCINGTYTYAGYLLSRWTSDNSLTDLNINKALTASLRLLEHEGCINLSKSEEKFVALIFEASAIDINYRFSALAYKVPIALVLNEKRLDKIESIQYT